MRTFYEITPDLGNGLSGVKGVFDKISKEMVFAASKWEYEGKLRREDCLYFIFQQGIIAFERQFLVAIT